MATLRGLKVSGPLSDHFFRKDAFSKNALLRWVCIVPMINLNIGLDQAINGGSGDIFTFILYPRSTRSLPGRPQRWGTTSSVPDPAEHPVENTTKTRTCIIIPALEYTERTLNLPFLSVLWPPPYLQRGIPTNHQTMYVTREKLLGNRFRSIGIPVESACLTNLFRLALDALVVGCVWSN